MDLETEKIKARLEALETALVAMAKRDPAVLELLRDTLAEREASAVTQPAPRSTGGFQRVITMEPAPYRDELIEKAKVDAYKNLRQRLTDAY